MEVAMPTRQQIERERIIKEKGRRCVYCGAGPLYRRALHLDHLVPKSAGGSDAAHNRVPSCAACNIRKGSKDVRTYALNRLVKLQRERGLLEAILEPYAD